MSGATTPEEITVFDGSEHVLMGVRADETVVGDVYCGPYSTYILKEIHGSTSVWRRIGADQGLSESHRDHDHTMRVWRRVPASDIPKFNPPPPDDPLDVVRGTAKILIGQGMDLRVVLGALESAVIDLRSKRIAEDLAGALLLPRFLDYIGDRQRRLDRQTCAHKRVAKGCPSCAATRKRSDGMPTEHAEAAWETPAYES